MKSKRMVQCNQAPGLPDDFQSFLSLANIHLGFFIRGWRLPYFELIVDRKQCLLRAPFTSLKHDAASLWEGEITINATASYQYHIEIPESNGLVDFALDEILD